jgi:hypothetical protein
MRVLYKKYSIQIVPENDADEVYLETVCNTKIGGDVCLAKRVDAMGLHAWAYLEIKKYEEQK